MDLDSTGKRTAGALILITGGLLSWGAQAQTADPAPANSGADDTASLRRELQQEEQKIQALEQRLAADEAARAAAPPAPAVAIAPTPAAAPPPNSVVGSFSPQGYTLQSADGANAIRFRGNLSVDDRQFTDANTSSTANTWLIRKLRPTFEGTLDSIYDFRFMPDFGQGKTILQDGWGDARIEPWLVVTFGKFKAPVGIERLQLEQFARFIEPSLTSDLLPYRDLGAQVGGTIDKGLLSYTVGQFDGVVDAGSTDGNTTPDVNSTGHFTLDARVFSKPFVLTDWEALRGLGLGVAGTYVNWNGTATATTTTSLLASYKSTGQQSMFSYRGNTITTGTYNNATVADGVERRWVPQLYWAYQFVSLMGEYVDEQQEVHREIAAGAGREANLHNTAWQLQAAVFLTGEHEGYDVATPRRDFGWNAGGRGAWELVGRVHQLRFDHSAFDGGSESFANPTSAPLAARALGAGVNWYLNRNFKMQLDYEWTRFEGGAAVGDRPDERVLTSQFALIY